MSKERTMDKAVIGIVETQIQADKIIGRLHTAGFASSDISVLFPDKSGTRDFAYEHGTKLPEGAAAGAGTGGLVGGAIGLLAGLGALAIPGFGPLLAAGPLLATLSGAAAGAAVGGLTGALVGLGIPEIQAKHYEGKIKGGNILLAVHVNNADGIRSAEQIMKSGGAHDTSSTTEASVPRQSTTSP
jgi:outer membrane lipoprotein SlyB